MERPANSAQTQFRSVRIDESEMGLDIWLQK